MTNPLLDKLNDTTTDLNAELIQELLKEKHSLILLNMTTYEKVAAIMEDKYDLVFSVDPKNLTNTVSILITDDIAIVLNQEETVMVIDRKKTPLFAYEDDAFNDVTKSYYRTTAFIEQMMELIKD